MVKLSPRVRDLLEVAVLLGVWAMAIAIIRPVGDFPLHDDWDFAIATWRFARTGQFHFTQFTAVSLRAQVLWGALWTHFFGESFEVLRASTLTLSAATIVLLHRILRQAPVPPAMRVIAPLAFLFHPIFLWASCTYMTDVPYVFASVSSFYFFFRGLKEDRIAFVIMGCLATMASWFVRQNGVINAVAVLALLFLARGRLTRRWLSFSAVIAATVAIFAALFLFRRDLLAGTPDMFALHYHMWQESSFRLPEQIAVLYHYVTFNALNLAMFFLPLTLPLLAMDSPLSVAAPKTPRGKSKRAQAQARLMYSIVLLLVVAAAIFLRVIFLARAGYYLPYNTRYMFSDILPGPIFIDFAVGPPNLGDTFMMEYPYPFQALPAARMILTFVVAYLAVLLVSALTLAFAGAMDHAKKNCALLLAVAFAVTGTLALFGSGYYYDRYSLDSAWAVAIALPIVIPWGKRLARIAAVCALVAVAFFSSLAVQEYFRWNRARWDAFNSLRSRGVAVERIDGGTEPYALYELADADRGKARRGHPPRQYMIAFHQLPGYTVIEARAFSGFLGTRRGTIYTLRRHPERSEGSQEILRRLRGSG